MNCLPQLTRRLVLENPERAGDGAGGFHETWVALGHVWAEIEGRSGRDAARAGQPTSKTQYKITVRAAPVGSPDRPVPDQRFREGTRIFAITAVFERDVQGRFLTCLAEEEISA